MANGFWDKDAAHRARQGHGPGDYSNRSSQEQQERQAAREREQRRLSDQRRTDSSKW